MTHTTHTPFPDPLLLCDLAAAPGACGGECACSTCHIILAEENFETLEEAEEEEEDMLDLALGLTDTSRLGCQIEVTADMDGWVITIPEESESMI